APVKCAREGERAGQFRGVQARTLQKTWPPILAMCLQADPKSVPRRRLEARAGRGVRLPGWDVLPSIAGRTLATTRNRNASALQPRCRKVPGNSQNALFVR